MADKPVTREEKYLAYLTGDYTGELPKPITRKEKYLYKLCLKGIGGEISPEEIKAAVNEYLEKNPVKPGATTEQAQQIEQNKMDVASLKEETGSLKEELSKFTTVVIGKNIFFSEWTETGYGIHNDTGVDKNGGSYQRTGYVEVEAETTYTASTDFGKAPSVSIFYYDENKTFLSRYDTPYGFYPKTFTTPSNTKYLRIRQTYQAMPTNFQIEKGENATDYETPKREIMIPYSKITGIPSGTGGVSIANKKWLFLGDSITAMTGVNSWVDKFKELVSAHANSYNQAVGGSKWCDDEQGIIYDGKPYQGNKFIGNQVKWCENIGFSSDAFDCIIIAAGTNDTNLNFPNDDEIENAFYNGNSLKSLDGVNRSTWQGSVRYSVQRLKEMYPNAKIILVTPLQRKVDFDTSVTKDMYPIIRQKREIITKMARRMGVYIIDTCEANITDMSTDVHGDGLHLNQKGSTIMAEFMFRKIMPIMCDYN